LEHERNCRNSDRKGNHRSKSRKLIIVQTYLERGHNCRSRRRSLQALALAEMVMSTQLHPRLPRRRWRRRQCWSAVSMVHRPSPSSPTTTTAPPRLASHPPERWARNT
jgi:hypothetical protein